MGVKLSREEARSRLIGCGLPLELDEIEIRGEITRVWKHAPLNLRDVFAATVAHGDEEFLVLGDERISYAEQHDLVCRFAQALLQRYDVRHGDRVALAMRNIPEWSVAFWAITSIGAIVVPLNAWLSAAELKFCLENSGSKVAVVDEERSKLLDAHRGNSETQSVIVVRADHAVLDSAMDRWEDVLAGVPLGAPLPKAMIEPDDDATIFYTSGTTGQPKGAVGTHRNICSNIMTVAYRAAMKQLCRGVMPAMLGGKKTAAVTLVPVPFFHVTGCHSILCPSVLSGAKLILMHRWDPERALELIEREKVTNLVGVPGMVLQILASPHFKNYDTSSLVSIGYGGAPAMPKLAELIGILLPQADAENGYGLTEASAVVSFNAGEHYRRKPESSGHPAPVCNVKIVDDSGRDLPAGTLGEVFIKGPNVVRGYWNNPKASSETFIDGWMRTGDVGLIDEEGCLDILDRSKDMLIRGGENVYCIEVENALNSHPAVMEAAVIGKPHSILGQEVAAVVRIVPTHMVSEQELIGYCETRIAKFKVPVLIDVRHEPLPCNAAGKIVKRQLQIELFPHLHAESSNVGPTRAVSTS